MNKKIFIVLLFLMLSGVILLEVLNNPNYVSSCYDGDDLIDDDVCVTVDYDSGVVDMYQANQERDYSEWVVFIGSILILFFALLPIYLLW